MFSMCSYILACLASWHYSLVHLLPLTASNRFLVYNFEDWLLLVLHQDGLIFGSGNKELY